MPAPGFSIEATLANVRVCRTIEDVIDAWYAVEDALLGALEHDEAVTPHLADCGERLPVVLRQLREAERLAEAEVAATRTMLGGQSEEG
jgi:hypothetical protein